MPDVRTLANINLGLQSLLVVGVLLAALLAKRRQLVPHCGVMRAAGVLQLLSVFLVMLPSGFGYLKNPGSPLFQVEMVAHHIFGVSTVLLWIYVNLAFMGKVKTKSKLATWMRIAFSVWVVSFFIGLHLYYQIYLS